MIQKSFKEEGAQENPISLKKPYWFPFPLLSTRLPRLKAKNSLEEMNLLALSVLWVSLASVYLVTTLGMLA